MTVRTSISKVRSDGISIRDRDLVDELIGKASFTRMSFLLIAGREPEEREEAMLDACLVALADHGLTLSAVVARATDTTAPDAIQGAVAAGLLGVGSTVVGSMEGCGRALQEIAERRGDDGELDRVVADYVERTRAAGVRIGGLGHAFHKGGDPRADRLLELARELGVAGTHTELLGHLAAEVGRQTGRDLPINVTGAIAAVLMDMGFEWWILRGFALMARCAGLVAHVREEHEAPIVPDLRRQLREASQGD
jgi:citrate synthase